MEHIIGPVVGIFVTTLIFGLLLLVYKCILYLSVWIEKTHAKRSFTGNRHWNSYLRGIRVGPGPYYKWCADCGQPRKLRSDGTCLSCGGKSMSFISKGGFKFAIEDVR